MISSLTFILFCNDVICSRKIFIICKYFVLLFFLQHDSGIYLDPGICFSPYEVMDNLNHGSVPISHSSPSSEGAAPPLMDINFLPQVEDNESQVPKKHIAYHLLSNLLDDEITDDSRSGVQEARTSRTDGGEV